MNQNLINEKRSMTIAWVACASLCFFTLSVYVIYTIAWARTGQRPQYPHYDPESMGLIASAMTLPVGLFVLFFPLPFGVCFGLAVLDIMPRVKSSSKKWPSVLKSPLVLCVLSALGFILSIALGIPEWLID